MTSITTRARIALSRETTGGVLVLVGAATGLLLANTAARDSFHRLSGSRLGPLTADQWAQDVLLSLFFLTVGLELIQEIRAGSLRDPRRAAVPILAACGGVATPALCYAGVLFAMGAGHYAHGWAIPTATDIAFALMVLVLAGRGAPAGLRVFLLTVAVVDDLIGILIIAIVYSHGLRLPALIGAAAAVAVFGWLARRPRVRWWLLAPVAVLAWLCVHSSGVHATIAGVALGLVMPTRRFGGELVSRATRLGQLVQPVSNAVALPVFAVFAAGIPLSAGSRLVDHPVAWAVAIALVVGKPLGIMATTALVTRWTPLRMAEGLTLRDLLPVGLLCGIGFTVAMLIAGLSFEGAEEVTAARAAVLIGSLLSAVLGAALLHHDRLRREHRDRSVLR